MVIAVSAGRGKDNESNAAVQADWTFSSATESPVAGARKTYFYLFIFALIYSPFQKQVVNLV